jgi:hypothetical protein
VNQNTPFVSDFKDDDLSCQSLVAIDIACHASACASVSFCLRYASSECVRCTQSHQGPRLRVSGSIRCLQQLSNCHRCLELLQPLYIHEQIIRAKVNCICEISLSEQRIEASRLCLYPVAYMLIRVCSSEANRSDERTDTEDVEKFIPVLLQFYLSSIVN